MEIGDYYALCSGRAPLPDGRWVQLTVVDLGELYVESGLLGACDPYVNLDAPTLIPVPSGHYPVRATMVDLSETQDRSLVRPGYLSVVLSESEAASVEAAPNRDGPPGPGRYWGIEVDAGTVAFLDAEAATRCMPYNRGDWFSEIFRSGKPDSWWAQQMDDDPLPPGTANIVLPLATRGENLILSRAGYGDDGFYALDRTLAPDGTVTGIHIDFYIIGKPEE
ncbi:DUF4241 domain-containing protein [Microbacterium sp. SS28]|uniref:DUF4241 domain-containing protein n=1 Tax=Microbacterium sp. SS28 TaxID=2919948 RepID=UPI001FA9A237|nr:DUF4241 domain-containing protein [Microbacterium sp. SS28]